RLPEEVLTYVPGAFTVMATLLLTDWAALDLSLCLTISTCCVRASQYLVGSLTNDAEFPLIAYVSASRYGSCTSFTSEGTSPTKARVSGSNLANLAWTVLWLIGRVLVVENALRLAVSINLLPSLSINIRCDSLSGPASTTAASSIPSPFKSPMPSACTLTEPISYRWETPFLIAATIPECGKLST